MPVFSQLPVRRVQPDESAPGDLERWPRTMPAVQQLLAEGLDLAPVTVLVGENGSGKSTIVEAIAMAFGLSAEGGSTHARHSTRATESDLHSSLHVIRSGGASRWGFFVRAETMHGFYTYLETNPNVGGASEPAFHEMSHGESFLSILAHRFDSPGFYVLDEPESALSFTGCLALVARLHELTADGRAQALVATHSPIVAAIPGADLYELGEWGLRRTTWPELALVDHWRRFLTEPDRYLRHVLSDAPDGPDGPDGPARGLS